MANDVLTTRTQWDEYWSSDETEEGVALDLEGTFPAKLIRAMKYVTSDPAEAKVVELGGGHGQFLLQFASAGYSTTAIDISEIGLSRTRKVFAELGFEVKCVCMDMFDISPNHAGEFDLVYSMGLCEHFTGVKRYQQFVQHRLLAKPGGAVVIMVPNRLSPFRTFWRIGRFLLSHLPWLRARYDVVWVDEHQFTRWELRRLCEDAGLETVVEVGNSLLEDVYFFVWGGIKKFVCRSFGKSAEIQRGRYINFRTILDDYFGGELFILGLRKA